MSNLTLLDLAARTGSDALVGLIEDVTTSAPEFRVVLARPMPGTTYKLTRRTGLPTAAFRDANPASVGSTKSTYVQDLKQMYFLDCQLEVDEAIVKGDSREIGDILTDEAAGALEASFNALGSQFYYGTSADAKGFAGLASQLSDDTTFAGGTTTTTSAYLVDISLQGVHFVVGNDGEIAMPDWMKQKVAAGNMAFVSNISSYLGLNVGHSNAVFRVRGIDYTAAMTNKLTDAKGAQVLSKVPTRIVNKGTLRWFMNRNAAYSLQLSRSAVGQVDGGSAGLPAFAPMPTELQGIPIVITDSILNNETTTNS
jgi:hypothetical protein